LQFTVTYTILKCEQLGGFNMYEVRFYNDSDYETICDWWESWGWNPFPKEFLPKTGVVIEYQGQPICAGFVYKTDSLVAWGENYILNKDCPKEARSGCIPRLIDEMCEQAIKMGASVLMSSVENKSLIRKLEEKGFQIGDTGMVNLVKAL
jgi:hypothetical protein